MFGILKQAKTAGVFLISLSLALPTVGQAGVMQLRPASSLAQMPLMVPHTLPGLIQVKDKQDRKRAERRDDRRDARQDARRDDRRREARQEARQQARRDERRREARQDARRDDRRSDRQRYNQYNHPDRKGYRGGYRGYNSPRNGYRKDSRDGLFYPLAAFALGAVIINEINKNQQQGVTSSRGWSHIPAGNVNAHDNWCFGNYRSYRSSDKTFQPYNGPRRYCNSPYDAL